MAVSRSWGWWRCWYSWWRGGIIRAGARGKHRHEGAARSNYLQECPLGEGLRRQRDKHPLLFYIAGANKSWTYMWFMCLKKSPAALSGSAPCERGHGGGLPRRQLPRASRVAARRLLSASLPVAVPQPSRGLGRFGYTKCATTGPNTKAPYKKKHYRHSLEAHCTHTQFQQPRS